jgi:hypothetical protein
VRGDPFCARMVRPTKVDDLARARLRRRSVADANNQIVSDGAKGYIAVRIEHGL